MIRLALIGRGRWGQNIERTLEAIPGCEIAYIASTAKQAAAIPLDSVDGALIATPGSTHAAAALPFLGHGIPTFIEKPLTIRLRDAQRIVEAARKTKTSGMVGHIHLYNPAYQKAKQLLPKIGPILTIHSEGMNMGPIRDDMSALWDWGPHDVSMILDLIGRTPTSIQAWGIETLRPGKQLYDTAHVKLSFPGSTTATFINSWLSPEKRKKLVVVGKKGSIVYDDTAEQHKVTLRVKDTVTHPRYSIKQSPLEIEMRAFLGMIRSGKTPVSDLQSGLTVVKILDAAERSIMRSGIQIAV